jgi:hypothetical protein
MKMTGSGTARGAAGAAGSESDHPLRNKREVFATHSEQVAGQMREHGLSEGEIVADFESWRRS